MTNYNIAQLVSLVTLATTIWGLLSKEKYKIMLWFTLSNLSLLITYFLLGRTLGAILVFGATIRTVVYFAYARKNIRPSFIIMAFFETYFITLSFITMKDYADLFMLLNLCLLTYATWQNNIKIMRIGYVLSGILLITYDLLVGAHVNIITDLIVLFTTIYAIYKYNFVNKIDNIVINFYSTIKDSYYITLKENANYCLISSGLIKDSFNNFVFVKDAKHFSEIECEEFFKELENDGKLKAVYFYSENNENLDYIYTINKNRQLLYHDVWMKLKTGYTTMHRKPLLKNLSFRKGTYEDGKEIIEIFDAGFINVVGKNVYKYDYEYLEVYKEKFSKPNNLKNSIPYIAFYNDKPIAILTAYLTGTNAHLCQITTLQQFRKKGVASGLIDYAIKDLRYTYGVEDFYLVTEKYTFLETFYLKNNFEEVAQGFCYNYNKLLRDIIYTRESLLTQEYHNSSFVEVPLDEYEEYLKWKKERN